MTVPPSDPYHCGPGGYLLDRNGDGHPDDLAVRIVLPPDPAQLGADLWCALVDLGARLGLETTGLPERLVLTSEDRIPADCILISVDPRDSAGEVRALAVAGLPPGTTGDTLDTPPPAIADLAKLFTTSGLLCDRDGDHLPDGTRLALLLPDPCPPAIGIAAIEFAARLGLESGGIDLPLARGAGTEVPEGAVVLDLSGSHPNPDARLELAGDRLSVSGDETGIATLLSFLATTWPGLSAETAAAANVGGIVEEIRDLATGASASSTFEGDEVFTLDWEDRWEVDRVRDLVRDEVIPAIVVGGDDGPIDLLVLVSEPPENRRALESELASLLAAVPPEGTNLRVRVRSAYKAGLSWLREDVIPALSALTGIDRVEFRYASAPAIAEGTPPRLDLSIRWLQELYPGDELLATALGLSLDAVDLVEHRPSDGAVYEVVALRDGTAVWSETFSPRWYELPYIALDPSRGSVLVSTGGVRATRGETVLFDRDVPTDCDRFWAWFQGVVLPRVGDHVREVTGGIPRLADQPFFAALRVDAWVSEPNEPLSIREEIDSAAEALHEDVYFGALDWLAAFGPTLGGDELNGPGAILPFIHVAPGQAPRARVCLRARRELVTLASRSAPKVRVTGLTVGPRGLTGMELTLDLPADGDTTSVSARLNGASSRASVTGHLPVTIRVGTEDPIAIDRPVPVDDLAGVAPSPDPPSDRHILFGDDLLPLLARLRARPGVDVRQIGRSFQGRPLWAIELKAPMPTRIWSPTKLSLRKPTLLIVGRHHANEVASTTAVFLLAERLTGEPAWRSLLDSLSVVVLPFANPDGAALHEELVAEHPTWKHHAARYNVVGLEFGFSQFDEQTPFGEARARRTLWDRWLPDIIVDNHGVPSHEWSQHFAGFGSPPRFPTCYWMVQALLYAIITHPETPEHTPFALELRRRLARAVRETPELDAINRVYGHRYDRWGTSRVPDRFPAEFEDEFLCYFKSAAPDPASRNFALRYPATTTLDWVTEVPDETAHGDQLALTAKAHLVANEVTMRMMAELAPPIEHVVERGTGDSVTIRLRRRRPL